MLPGTTYHFFNHANGNENLFREEKNYSFFLEGISKHLLPVSDIYAYCLMPNHFHLLGRIKSEEKLREYFHNPPVNLSYDQMIKKAGKSFSNLFNSYTQSFNKIYDRIGSLFMQNLKKDEVNDEDSFCKVVHYIHANPVHHRFVKRIQDWPHSSYKIFLSEFPTRIDRNYVLNLFGGIERFIEYHEQPIDPKFKFLEK